MISVLKPVKNGEKFPHYGVAKIKISVIIVNYNDWKLLDTCLASIYKYQFPWPMEIIVTDNDSDNNEAQKIREKYPNVILIETGKNLGFAGGNNIAIARSKGDYVFILNDDTKYLNDTKIKAVEYMDQHPEIGMMGPELLNADGSHQGSVFMNNSLPAIFFSILKNSLYLDKITREKFFDISKIQPVGFILGAAMLVRREVINRVGIFDDRFFFSAEEQDWCYRTLKAGYKIFYYPLWQIVHYGGGTGGSLWYMMQYHRATIIYFDKYWGLPGRLAVKMLFLLFGHTRLFKTILMRLLKPADDYIKREVEKYFKILLWHFGILKSDNIQRVRDKQYSNQ